MRDAVSLVDGWAISPCRLRDRSTCADRCPQWTMCGPAGMLDRMPASRKAVGLALLLAVAGGSHFAVPRVYDPIVPRVLPGRPRTWTYLSGAAELAVAAAVAHPRTRRAGGLAAAALFAAVFPANLKMARDWRRRPPAYRAAAVARLPMQAPLIWWALRVAGEARRHAAARVVTPG